MDILDVTLLPALLLIFVGVVHSDIKSQKIKNVFIKAGFFWGISIILFLNIFPDLMGGLNGFLMAHPWLGNIYKNSDSYLYTAGYSMDSLINFCIALVVGYSLWKFEVWAPGDGKLFAISVLLIPLKYYGTKYFPYFPAFALLVNIFVVAAAVVFLESVAFFFWRNFIKGDRNLLRGYAEKVLNKKKASILLLAEMILGSFSIGYFMRVMLGAINSGLGHKLTIPLVIISVLFIIFEESRKALFGSRLWMIGGNGLVVIFLVFSVIRAPFQAIHEILGLLFLNGVLMAAFLSFKGITNYYLKNIDEKKTVPFAVFVLVGTIVTLILRAPITFIFKF